MKRIIYITLFSILGLLAATLVHAGIEIPTLYLITGDLERYGDSWVWRNWQLLHGYAGAALWLAGAGIGLWLGVRFWQILYVEKRYGEKKW